MGAHYTSLTEEMFKAQMLVSDELVHSPQHPRSNFRLSPVLLGISPIIPNQSDRHQDVYPAAVPPSLLNTSHASRLQPADQLPRHLRNMDRHQRMGELRPARQILGSHRARILL